MGKLSNESQWTNKQTQTLCSLSLTISVDLLIMALTKTHSLWKNKGKVNEMNGKEQKYIRKIIKWGYFVENGTHVSLIST